MARKTSTITLVAFEAIDDGPNHVTGTPYLTLRKWRVVRVTDSIEFTPGDRLERATVEELVASSQWRVTVQEEKKQ